MPRPKECFDCPGLPETFSWVPQASYEVFSAQPGSVSWGHVGSSPFVTTYHQAANVLRSSPTESPWGPVNEDLNEYVWSHVD